MSNHPIRLRLIRHPKPDIEVGICYGRSDIAADASDLKRLVLELAGTPRPDLVYSSPLQRCHHTALAMAEAGWPAPDVDHRVAEMNFGDWEGQRWDAIDRVQIEAWRRNIADHVPPGGESVRDIASRAHHFARDLRERHGRHGRGRILDIVVFTHAGIIQTLPRIWRGEALSGFSGTRVEYGSTTELLLD